MADSDIIELVPDDTKAMRLVKWVADKSLKGLPPLNSAHDLALEYRIDQSYENDDERVASLINWETSKNFTSGFITGLGGIISLPIAIPAAFGASWVIQARMAGAIAILYGHDIREDRVKTLILLSLVGDAVKEVLKEAGVKLGQRLTQKAIASISAQSLMEINKRVGFRLITKAGQQGVINLSRSVPVVGGLVSGSFDAVACRAVGRVSVELFRPK